MNDVTKLLQLEVKDIGKKADSNNRIIYSDEYGLPGQPWCVMFQWYKFREAGLSNIFYNGKKTASCSAFYAWAKREGLIVSNIKDAQPGDIIIFSFRKTSTGLPETSHMGLCYGKDNNGIYSIDGNTATVGNEANGMQVLKRYRGWPYVLYVIRPRYSKAVTEQETPQNKIYIVQSGDTLSKIAARNNTTVAEILKKNPQIKNPNLIYRKQVINL